MQWRKYPENKPEKETLYLCKGGRIGNFIYRVIPWFVIDGDINKLWKDYDVTHWCEIEEPKE